MTRSELQAKILSICDGLLTVAGLLSAIIFFRQVGFHLSEKEQLLLSFLIEIIVLFFLFQEGVRWIFISDWRLHLRERALEHITALLIILSALGQSHLFFWLHPLLPTTTSAEVVVAYLGFTQLWILMAHVLRWLRESEFFTNLQIGPNRLFMLSFIFAIAILTLLLKLPRSTVTGISWVDALFTAVSAICVTGLSTVDLGSEFTPLGQFFVVCGIQVGGLGIMTLTMSLGSFFKGGLGVKERLLLGDMLNAERIGEVGRLLMRITYFTIAVEAIGGLVLFVSMFGTEQLGTTNLTWSVIFHAISAFCNAGFSLYKDNLMTDSLATNYLYKFAVMLLIVLGGIGFPVLSNVWDYMKARRTKSKSTRILLNTMSKLVLVSTLALLLFGTIVIWLLERNGSWSTMGVFDQWFQAAFLSVSTRTAGFNIWPTEALSQGAQLAIVALMWIGASPMSTGGGIKTLTFALALLTIRAVVIGKDRVEVFGKEISRFSILRCFVVIMASIMTLTILSLLIIVLEPAKPAGALVFEVFSALGTVGLSLGVTAQLAPPAKLLLILTMFVGRMGFLTLLTGLYFGRGTVSYKYLRENIQIS